jgi:hypothetical protein
MDRIKKLRPKLYAKSRSTKEKMKYCSIVTTLMLILLTHGFAQASFTESTNQSTSIIQSDTTNTSSGTEHNTDNDFTPALAFGAVIVIGFIFLCVGIGIALTIFGVLIISGLISIGVLSASILAGLHKKSFAVGFKTFLISASTVGGFILCGFGCWLLNQFWHWWNPWKALTMGSCIGLLSGFTFGLLVLFVLQKLTAFLKKQLN